MSSLIILSSLTGVVLGLRFKVLILVPAMVLVAAVTIGIGIAHGDGLWSLLLETVLTITALQVGYLGGTIVHFVIVGARHIRALPRSTAAVQNSAR